jgi:hypothetical protein
VALSLARCWATDSNPKLLFAVFAVVVGHREMLANTNVTTRGSKRKLIIMRLWLIFHAELLQVDELIVKQLETASYKEVHAVNH